MHRTHSLALLLGMTILVLPGRMPAQAPATIDEGWLARATTEGAASLAKYQALLPFLEETYEMALEGDNPRGTSTVTSRSVRLGDNAILEQTRKYLDHAKQTEVTLECDNAEYYFDLRRANPSSPFALTRYARGERKLATWKRSGGIHADMFYALKFTLETLVPSNRANLRAVRFDPETGTLLIEYVHVRQKIQITEKAILDPDRGWIFTKRSSYSSMGEGTTDYTYGKAIDGLNFPTGATTSSTWKNTSPHKTTRYISRVLDLKRTTKTDADFRLSAFGLPEPADVAPRPKPTPWYLWLLAAAGACGALGFASAYLHRRLKAAKSAESPR